MFNYYLKFIKNTFKLILNVLQCALNYIASLWIKWVWNKLIPVFLQKPLYNCYLYLKSELTDFWVTYTKDYTGVQFFIKTQLTKFKVFYLKKYSSIKNWAFLKLKNTFIKLYPDLLQLERFINTWSDKTKTFYHANYSPTKTYILHKWRKFTDLYVGEFLDFWYYIKGKFDKYFPVYWLFIKNFINTKVKPSVKKSINMYTEEFNDTVRWVKNDWNEAKLIYTGEYKLFQEGMYQLVRYILQESKDELLQWRLDWNKMRVGVKKVWLWLKQLKITVVMYKNNVICIINKIKNWFYATTFFYFLELLWGDLNEGPKVLKEYAGIKLKKRVKELSKKILFFQEMWTLYIEFKRFRSDNYKLYKFSEIRKWHQVDRYVFKLFMREKFYNSALYKNTYFQIVYQYIQTEITKLVVLKIFLNIIAVIVAFVLFENVLTVNWNYTFIEFIVLVMLIQISLLFLTNNLIVFFYKNFFRIKKYLYI